jgi:hypothetical protein
MADIPGFAGQRFANSQWLEPEALLCKRRPAKPWHAA